MRLIYAPVAKNGWDSPSLKSIIYWSILTSWFCVS